METFVLYQKKLKTRLVQNQSHHAFKAEISYTKYVRAIISELCVILVLSRSYPKRVLFRSSCYMVQYTRPNSYYLNISYCLIISYYLNNSYCLNISCYLNMSYYFNISYYLKISHYLKICRPATLPCLTPSTSACNIHVPYHITSIYLQYTCISRLFTSYLYIYMEIEY